MEELKVGLQLYSVRDEMSKDMDATLKKVKDMGYDYVEFAGYFGKTAEEVLSLLKKHDLKCMSVHQAYEVFLKDEEESVSFLKKIGAKYSAMPWLDIDRHAGSDNFEQTKEEFIRVGNILKDAGITHLYHNHDFEFKTHEGKYLLDWLFESLPEDLLETQIDTCWVKYAGIDPAEYIKKYTARAPIVHLKDFVSDENSSGPVYDLIDEEGKVGDRETSLSDNGFDYRPLGQGIQDFPSIIEAASQAGVTYLIVEQDESNTCSQLEAAKISREYLRSLKL